MATVIRDFDIIPTVARDGRVPFVGVDDIAKASYDALVTEKNINTDYYVLGPQLYSHDEVSRLPSFIEAAHNAKMTGCGPLEQGPRKEDNAQTHLRGRIYRQPRRLWCSTRVLIDADFQCAENCFRGRGSVFH